MKNNKPIEIKIIFRKDKKDNTITAFSLKNQNAYVLMRQTKKEFIN